MPRQRHVAEGVGELVERLLERLDGGGVLLRLEESGLAGLVLRFRGDGRLRELRHDGLEGLGGGRIVLELVAGPANRVVGVGHVLVVGIGGGQLGVGGGQVLVLLELVEHLAGAEERAGGKGIGGILVERAGGATSRPRRSCPA